MATRDGGIPSWDQKLLVLRRLLGAYSLGDVADLVLPRDLDVADQAKKNFRKWKSFRPRRNDGPKLFFDKLPTTLGCAGHVTGVMLIESSIDEFIELLPEESKKVARRVLQEGETNDLPARADEIATKISNASTAEAEKLISKTFSSGLTKNFRTMNFHSRAKIEPIESGIRAGHVNQRHYYLTPDAATTWSNVVRAEAYPTYDQCKAGLRALVDHDVWRTTISRQKHSTVVMLAGGGAPTKDIVLINSLLRSDALVDRAIDYILIDYSYYMLVTSHLWLEDSLSHLSDATRVTIHTIQHDILDLKECESGLRLSDNVIFGMTGGTIGNLNEAEFFNSLSGVARAGDLLILSADTLEDIPLSEAGPALIKKYNHGEVRRFILPAVRAAVAEYDLPESVSSVFSRIKVSLEDAKSIGLSSVDRTASVTLRLEVEKKDVVLLSSTRYNAVELEAFARSFGWTLLVSTASPLNANFMQFLFQRN